jgi:hypothetical protein
MEPIASVHVLVHLCGMIQKSGKGACPALLSIVRLEQMRGSRGHMPHVLLTGSHSSLHEVSNCCQSCAFVINYLNGCLAAFCEVMLSKGTIVNNRCHMLPLLGALAPCKSPIKVQCR